MNKEKFTELVYKAISDGIIRWGYAVKHGCLSEEGYCSLCVLSTYFDHKGKYEDKRCVCPIQYVNGMNKELLWKGECCNEWKVFNNCSNIKDHKKAAKVMIKKLQSLNVEEFIKKMEEDGLFDN